MKVLAFAASSSKKSINKQLVAYACHLLSDEFEYEVIDLNDYTLPIFSVDLEEEIGQPENAKAFIEKINVCDSLIVSFAEHNGSYTAAYKNLFDWASRIERNFFQNKPLVALATSPGKGGAKNVLTSAVASMPHFGGNLLGSLSIPSFHDNFDTNNQRITNNELNDQLKILLEKLK